MLFNRKKQICCEPSLGTGPQKQISNLDQTLNKIHSPILSQQVSLPIFYTRHRSPSTRLWQVGERISGALLRATVPVGSQQQASNSSLPGRHMFSSFQGHGPESTDQVFSTCVTRSVESKCVSTCLTLVQSVIIAVNLAMCSYLSDLYCNSFLKLLLLWFFHAFQHCHRLHFFIITIVNLHINLSYAFIKEDETGHVARMGR